MTGRGGRDGGLRKCYRTHLPEIHWTSVESPFTIQGIPDSNFCHDGVEGWIENKRVRRADVVEMRPEQVAWIERRARAGGRVFIAVRWAMQADSLFLLAPQAGRALLGLGLASLPRAMVLGRWSGGPSQWKWPKIAEILLYS